MECNAAASDAGKQPGGRTKTPGIPTSTRMQRNLAEKERRDKLNGFISELATLVPMVSNASKPLDKVSILRLAAAEMRLHFSCLNPKKYKNKPLTLPPAIISSLDLIEKTIGGFILVTTLSGVIVFCSRSIEDYLGYQNIDVMGNKVVKYIYEDDIKYFEAKVNSVVNSLKKSSKKKSRVIKAHMLQKPLPRSNECSRPRNMIFKISVHQNDISEMNSNGMSEQSSSTVKKTRPPKDFGYSAVVLMFIEPVRLEPEIDITYIDSNQDVYFTRHGLQGEIIYADQRISSITGYMPHDVQGTSAYQYICSSDVPIALFAQKAMFTSNDGKGVIVYRLRIRDMRFIYLQSSGQIAYKESSNEISHFVCFNRLLSEEEGSQELKKFQQRYAPQIMAAKMLKVKQSEDGGQPQSTDLVLEQAFAFIKSSGMADTSPVSQKSPFQYSKDAVDSVKSSNSQKPQSEGLVSPCSNSSVGPSSVHSSEGHSIISPQCNGSSSSVGSDFSGYISEQVETHNKKTARSDGTTFTTNPYCTTLNNSVNESDFSPESRGSCASGNNLVHMMEIGKLRHPEIVNTNGSCSTLQTGSTISSKLQNEVMHSVNAYSNPQNSITDTSSSGEVLSGHTLDLVFDNTVLQKNASFTIDTVPSNTYAIQSNGIMPSMNEQQTRYIRYNEQTSNIQPEKVNGHLLNVQSNLQVPTAPIALLGQQLNFNGQHMSQNRLSHFNDVSSFLGMNQVSSVSSLSKNSLSVVSDLSDALGCNSGIGLYRENSSFSNSYLPNSISSYNNGANESVVYNDLSIIGTKSFNVNQCETNGFHVPTSSGNTLANFPSASTFDAMDTSVETNAVNQTPDKCLGRQIELSEISFTATNSLKPPNLAVYHNGSSDDFCGEPLLEPLDWDIPEVHPSLAEGVDSGINKELYRELDLFFQNLPQSDNMRDASVLEELPTASSSSYSQNSISSSKAKTNYHH